MIIIVMIVINNVVISCSRRFMITTGDGVDEAP